MTHHNIIITEVNRKSKPPEYFSFVSSLVWISKTSEWRRETNIIQGFQWWQNQTDWSHSADRLAFFIFSLQDRNEVWHHVWVVFVSQQSLTENMKVLKKKKSCLILFPPWVSGFGKKRCWPDWFWAEWLPASNGSAAPGGNNDCCFVSVRPRLYSWISLKQRGSRNDCYRKRKEKWRVQVLVQLELF